MCEVGRSAKTLSAYLATNTLTAVRNIKSRSFLLLNYVYLFVSFLNNTVSKWSYEVRVQWTLSDKKVWSLLLKHATERLITFLAYLTNNKKRETNESLCMATLLICILFLQASASYLRTIARFSIRNVIRNLHYKQSGQFR